MLAYAVLNAALYSTLLPLWEGFDELFHFGYVQQLANGRGFVDVRDARLTKEVAASVPLAPVSKSVKVNLRTAPLYSEFFSWSAVRRSQARQALGAIPAAWRGADSEIPNYEAHHPPLAYALLALPERLLARTPLPRRVWLLRLLASIAGALLLCCGAYALCRELGLAEVYCRMTVFCVLSSQMTWAAIAHIANDWLAVPLAIWTLVFAIRSAVPPGKRPVIAVSLLVSAGLLAKAYFLAFEPLVFAVCALRPRRLLAHVAIVAAIAGPWYVRNQAAYGTLTGMQEARAGLGPAAVLHGAAALPWPQVARDSVRAALWTGNNTFRVFSTGTMDVLILACAAGLVLWAIGKHTAAERITAAYCASFVPALAYAAVIARLATAGASSTPSPWYGQPIVTPLLALVFLGASRRRRAGAALAAAIALLFGYVLAVTYLFRLIPLYSGYDGRGSLGAVLHLYAAQFAELTEKLGAAALGPPWLIFSLAATVVVLIALEEARFIRRMLPPSPSGPVPRRGPASLSRRTQCVLRAALPALARLRRCPGGSRNARTPYPSSSS